MDKPTEVMCVVTLIYGVKPSGAQCQVSIEKLANHFIQQGRHLEAAAILKEEVYVDDVMASGESVEECFVAALGIEEILDAGSMGVKAFTFSGQAPSDAVSGDGIHVGLGGYLWRPEADLLLLDVGPPRLGKAKRGKMPEPISGDFGEALKKCFTRRVLAGVVARVFDPLGLATPITANLKLCLHDLCMRKLDWDDAVPMELLDVWKENMMAIQDLKEVLFNRAVIPQDAASPHVNLIVAVDASQNIGVAAIFARVVRKNGSYSCQLMMARSKIMADLTVPRAELKSAVMGAISAQNVKRNLGDCLGDVMYVTDSAISLHWIHQDDRPLQVAVRNAVIEVRRFSRREEWFHVESGLNIADLGTRKVSVADISFNSEWQVGKDWMSWPRQDMPVRKADELMLSAEEKRAAAVEMRAKDIHGHTINLSVGKVAERYAFSKYILDPRRFSWSKAVRIVALIFRFIGKLKRRRTASHNGSQPGAATGWRQPAVGAGDVPDCLVLSSMERCTAAIVIEPEEIQEAEEYFFKLATKELKQFSKLASYKDCSEEKDGILYFTGRLLDSRDIVAMESVMFDLNPLSFCKPIIDRYSPVAYSIMVETHWKIVSHLNASCTFRESLSLPIS